MRYFLALFSILFIGCLGPKKIGKDSDKWIETVYGKPDMRYFEAKELTAKEWGINYEPKFMGCILDEKENRKLDKIEKSNKIYLQKLESKHGKDWSIRFELDIKKHIPIYTDAKIQKWQVPVLGLPKPYYFEACSQVAKEWGINYEPIFLGCDPTEEGVGDTRKKATEESKPYLEDIANHFGPDWRTYFNKEVEKREKELANKYENER